MIAQMNYFLDRRFDLTKLPDRMRQMRREIVVEKEFHAARDSYRNAVLSADKGIS